MHDLLEVVWEPREKGRLYLALTLAECSLYEHRPELRDTLTPLACLQVFPDGRHAWQGEGTPAGRTAIREVLGIRTA